MRVKFETKLTRTKRILQRSHTTSHSKDLVTKKKSNRVNLRSSLFWSNLRRKTSWLRKSIGPLGLRWGRRMSESRRTTPTPFLAIHLTWKSAPRQPGAWFDEAPEICNFTIPAILTDFLSLLPNLWNKFQSGVANSSWFEQQSHDLKYLAKLASHFFWRRAFTRLHDFKHFALAIESFSLDKQNYEVIF